MTDTNKKQNSLKKKSPKKKKKKKKSATEEKELSALEKLKILEKPGSKTPPFSMGLLHLKAASENPEEYNEYIEDYVDELERKFGLEYVRMLGYRRDLEAEKTSEIIRERERRLPLTSDEYDVVERNGDWVKLENGNWEYRSNDGYGYYDFDGVYHPRE